jgi:hypothetical protein
LQLGRYNGAYQQHCAANENACRSSRGRNHYPVAGAIDREKQLVTQHSKGHVIKHEHYESSGEQVQRPIPGE